MNEVILTAVTVIIRLMSPELRKALKAFLDELARQASETSNPWDDIVVAILKILLINE